MSEILKYIEERSDFERIFNVSDQDVEMLKNLNEHEEDTLIYYDGKLLFGLRDPKKVDKIYIAWCIQVLSKEKPEKMLLIEKSISLYNDYITNKIDFKTFMLEELNEINFENSFFGDKDVFSYISKKEVLKIVSKLNENSYHIAYKI